MSLENEKEKPIGALGRKEKQHGNVPCCFNYLTNALPKYWPHTNY